MKKTAARKKKKSTGTSVSGTSVSGTRRRRQDCTESGFLGDLKRQKVRYEDYFEKEGAKTGDLKLDHQALSAYTNLIKTMSELKRKIREEGKKKKLSDEKLKELAREVFLKDYGVAVEQS